MVIFHCEVGGQAYQMALAPLNIILVESEPCGKHLRVVLPLILHPLLALFLQKCQPVAKGQIQAVGLIQAPLKVIVKAFKCFAYNGPRPRDLHGDPIGNIQRDLTLVRCQVQSVVPSRLPRRLLLDAGILQACSIRQLFRQL